MNTDAEMQALAGLARGASRVVELGVYEGSSAVVLCRALGHEAELHLVDPFLAGGAALRAGARANPTATRMAVRRACPAGGPSLHWHIARSQELGRKWRGGAIDLLFIDGDHSPQGCLEDWMQWHGHVAPGGVVAFHDARASQEGGAGHPGPTEVVDRLFRREASEWELISEADSLVAVRRH